MYNGSLNAQETNKELVKKIGRWEEEMSMKKREMGQKGRERKKINIFTALEIFISPDYYNTDLYYSTDV